MRLYILSTTGALVQGPGNLNPVSGGLTLKLATQEPMEIQYLDATGTPVLLPAGKVPQLGIKVLSHYDDVFVAVSPLLSAPADASGFYTGTLNCNTVQFAAAFGDAAGSTSAETDAVGLMGEVVYQVDTNGNLARSQTFEVTGYNRVFTGGEGTPGTVAQAYTAAQVTINLGVGTTPVTKRTGAAGDAAALANVATAGRALGTLFSFTEANNGLLVFFRLTAGPATVGDSNQVTPADFNATTNNVCFVLAPPTGAVRRASAAFAATVNVANPAGNPYVLAVGTLTGNVLLANPTGVYDRQRIEYVLRQDANGGRTLTLDTKFRFASATGLASPFTAANAPAFAAANKKTRLLVEYDAADDRFDVVSFLPGF